MLGKILFGVIKKSTRRLPIKTFGRTIASKGNGQRRFIVEGFSGRNIEPSSHFMRLARLNQANQRPVIKGFNPHYNEFQGTIVKPMPSKINRGGVKFFPNFTHEEIALTYGILGGMPYYLKMSANEESFKDNLINLFLKPDGRLTDAPFSILNLELSEPKRYDEIFKAMASGASRLNEIATYIHAETSTTI